MKICYQCDAPVQWLAPDSRCGDCTRYTPHELIEGEAKGGSKDTTVPEVIFPLSEEDEREWFKDVVLNGTGTLLLHSNEIGDELGFYHVTGSSIYKNTGEAKDGSKDTTVPEVPGDNNS